MKAYLNENGNPWHVFDELMDVFPYEEVFSNAWRARAGRYPRVNVWENKDGLVLEAEVAGIDPSKLDVGADGNTLTIKGEKTRLGEKTATFQRSFNLPFELDPAQIKATLKNGLLSVTIPRKASEKKQIAIQAL